MRIANGVEMFQIPVDLMGTPGVIRPTLMWGPAATILVDTGFPDQQDLLRKAVENAGVDFESLTQIILTHHDIDHIGGLAGLLTMLPNRPSVLAHEVEKDYIEGTRRPLKLARLEDNLDSLPEGMKVTYERLKAGFEKSWAPVDQTLVDGEELPSLGGITIIHTPGHTLGHICLYLQSSKTLVAGDALRVEDGKLVQTPAAVNYDQDLYTRSLKKLTQYDIETVICYHGGEYRVDANRRISELAA